MDFLDFYINGQKNYNCSNKKANDSMKDRQRFLLVLTICTWIIGSIIGIVFVFVMLDDISGLEWFGSPTFGMVILIVLMTSFYFIFRKKEIQPTAIVIIWFFFLFIATTVCMVAFAYHDLGQWEDFQTMPLLGTFLLILWAAGVHFSLKNVERKSLYIFTLWTVEFFLTVLFTMIALAYGPLRMWEDWQPYPIMGIGIWAGLITIAYFAIRSSSISWIDAGFYWSWSMFIGITTSMLSVFIVLLDYTNLWPIYPIAGTLGFAALFTTLKFTLKKSNVNEKLKE